MPAAPGCERAFLAALVGAVLPPEPPLSLAAGAGIEDRIARAVAEHLALMPDVYRIGVRVALLAANAAALVSSGRPLPSVPPPERAVLVDGLARSRLGPVRSAVDLVRSLALLYGHELEPRRAPETDVDLARLILPAASVRGTLECGALVVGSGPGGSTVASLLAEAGVDTLLAEEGAYEPLDVPAPWTTEEMRRKYRDGGIAAALGRPPVAYVEARCLGGGSEVNAALYHRTPAEALARWTERYGLRDLSMESLVPHFEAIEKDLSVGLLPGPAPRGSRLLEEGARSLGWRAIEVPRGFHFHGASGRRASMTRTLLPRGLAAGLRVVTGLRVERLLLRGARAIGVLARAGGHRVRIRARSVFVCAGAIQTPALLRRSGIVRGVGRTLALHPTVKVVASFDEPLDASAIPVHQVREFAPELSLGGSISTPGHVALALAVNGRDAVSSAGPLERCAVYYAAIRGPAHGSVRNLPGSRGGVLVRYPLGRSELHALSVGLARLARVLLAAGARAVVPVLRGHPPLRAPAEALAYESRVLSRREASVMTVHLMGSAPMGESARAACDSLGRVHGLDNVWIADASAVPDALGCNPQGTIVALARRCALRFLEGAT